MHEAQLLESRILIVDDDPASIRLLKGIFSRAGYSRVISTTDSRETGSLVDQIDPDLILLDLHMDPYDGFAVLEELRPRLSNTFLPVLVLTADATREAKGRALTSGAKDFLTKPLDVTEVLIRSRNLLQTRYLHLQERILLEQTLQGSIRTLVDLLAIVNPIGFSRAIRARNIASSLLDHLRSESRWEIEIAAMLSQLGSITLPADLAEKHYFGRRLTHAEAATVARVPEFAATILGNLPRMGEVVRILENLNLRFDGKGSPRDSLRGAELPWGARVLKVILDMDVLESRGLSPSAVHEVVRSREGWYDPHVVEAISEMREAELQGMEVTEIEIRAMRPGMVIAEDVVTLNGMLLVARGQEVTERLMTRIASSEGLLDPKQRVHVTSPPPVGRNGLDEVRSHPPPRLIPDRPQFPLQSAAGPPLDDAPDPERDRDTASLENDHQPE